MGSPSSTSYNTSSMSSLKMILYVCVLFVIGMEAAPNPEPKPEPAPTAPWLLNGGYPVYRSGGYPPYYGGYRRAGADWPNSCKDSTGKTRMEGEKWIDSAGDGCNTCSCYCSKRGVHCGFCTLRGCI